MLPAFTTPRTMGDPVELVVGVPADDGALGNALEDPPKPLVWRHGGDDVLVAPRRSVAEEDAAEPGDVDRHRLGQAGEEVQPLAA